MTGGCSSVGEIPTPSPYFFCPPSCFFLGGGRGRKIGRAVVERIVLEKVDASKSRNVSFSKLFHFIFCQEKRGEFI